MGVSAAGASATIGASDTFSQNLFADGLCNANADAYSTYVNVNWDGATASNDYRPTMTSTALDYTAITAVDGPNGLFSGRFTMDLNYVANWWNSNTRNTDSYDLFNNLDRGTSYSYSSSDWVY